MSDAPSPFSPVGSKLAFLAALAVTVLIAQSSAAQTFTVLHTFTGPPDGEYPAARLVMDAEGNLYGTTPGGGNSYNWGTAFELTPSGTETIIHTFGSSVSAFPWSSLIFDGSGNLYGTSIGETCKTCTPGSGTVFEITAERAFKVLYTFPASGVNSVMPQGPLVRDEEGNLYGTALQGGAYGMGYVFKVAPTGVETTLHNFAGGSDGAYPSDGLVMDSHGNLYGTTQSGGLKGNCGLVGCGTVFKITESGAKATIYRFNGPDGENPLGGLILDTASNLYGVTNSGGSDGNGTVFKLTSSHVETVLYSFKGGTDGMQPVGVLMDGHGNFYGTTNSGGTGCTFCGTVFKLTPGGTETVLYSFKGGADGWAPQAGLILDSHSNFYGTTGAGGDVGAACSQGCGIAFKLIP